MNQTTFLIISVGAGLGLVVIFQILDYFIFSKRIRELNLKIKENPNFKNNNEITDEINLIMDDMANAVNRVGIFTAIEYGKLMKQVNKKS